MAFSTGIKTMTSAASSFEASIERSDASGSSGAYRTTGTTGTSGTFMSGFMSGQSAAPRQARDITGAFWAFVGIMVTSREEGYCGGCGHGGDDLPVFKSDAYREMCLAVHSGDPLMVGAHPDDASSSYACTSIIFEDISALFRGKEAIERLVPPARAEELRRCFARVQSWVDAEELTSLFGDAFGLS
jgi:hypothetical protein